MLVLSLKKCSQLSLW